MFSLPPTRHVPVRMMARAAEGVVAQGIPFDRLLAECGMAPIEDDWDIQISPTQYLLLFTVMGRELRDFTHGLAARPFDGMYSRILINVILGSATLGGAIEAVQNLLKLGSSPFQIDLTVDQDQAKVRIYCEGRDDQASVVAEDTLMSWFSMCFRYFLGGAFQVSSVRTRDLSHVSLGRLHCWILAPVQSDLVTALTFPRRYLNAARVADPVDRNPHWEILRSAVEHFEGASEARSSQGSVSLSDLSFERMAREAGVSHSTLRRRMQTAGGGFREVRQRSLVDAGVSLLRTSDASVDAIAVELGYSEARSFRRFLKTATGRTPEEIRGAQRGVGHQARPAVLYDRLRDVAIQLDLAS